MINNISVIHSPQLIMFTDFISGDIENIHNSLFSAAYKTFKAEFKDKEGCDIIKFKEIKNIDFLNPSSVLVWYKDRHGIVSKRRVNLRKYWNNDYIKSRKNIHNELQLNNEEVDDYVVVKRNLVNGMAQVYSRYTGKYHWIPIELSHDLPNDTRYDNTFRKIMTNRDGIE